MPTKPNMIFLGIGVALLIAASINFLTSSDDRRHNGDEPLRIEPKVSITDGSSSASGESIMGKTMPPNHDNLVQAQNLRDMLEKNPEDREHWVMLGNLYFDMGQYESAIQPYEKALTLDPGDANVRVDYAVSLFNTGKNDQAVKELQKVIEDQPSHQTAFYNLGVILLHANQKDKAREYWAKAVSIDANSDLGRKAQQALSTLR